MSIDPSTDPSPDQPIDQAVDQAVAGLRHDLGALRGEVGERFDTADRQFSYLDRRFDDAARRLAGVEHRGAVALDHLADHVDEVARRASRRQLTALAGGQLAQLLVLALAVVAS